jgi:hypothetical protein
MSLLRRVERLEALLRPTSPAWQGRLANLYTQVEYLNDPLNALVLAAPEGLRAAVVARVKATASRVAAEIKAGQPSQAADLFRDGLIQWASWSQRDDDVPLPAELPAELVRVYLDDPAAMPFHECSECGLLVPTCGRRLREYFPACPVCGGQTGLQAWNHALLEAVKAVGLPWYTGGGRLAMLIEQGYPPGQRLSDWLATRPRGKTNEERHHP